MSDVKEVSVPEKSLSFVIIICNQYLQGVHQDANNVVLLHLLHGSDGGNSNFYTRLPCHGIPIKNLHLFVPIFHISMSERISSVPPYVEVEKACLVWQGYLTAAYFVFAVTQLFLRDSHDVETFSFLYCSKQFFSQARSLSGL